MICIACGERLDRGARFCPRCGTPARRSEGVGAVERRVVTVLFGDLSDFTAWAEALDPEQVGRLTDRVLRVMAQVVVAFGGHVDKLTGDGIMGVFGAPVAHEDDAERAVRAAAAMRDGVREVLAEEIGAGQRLGLHVGLNTGEVVAGVQAQLAYTVVGDAVNTASRLADAAHAGDIYAGEATVAAARTAGRWRPLAPLTLKGKLSPVAAYQLVGIADTELGWPEGGSAGPVATGAGSSPVKAGHEAPFVNRDAELITMERWFRATVESGSPSLCTVTGEAGVGKTRLLQEFTRRIGDIPGTLVVRGHCPPYGAERDVLPLTELVRDLCGARGERDSHATLLRLERTVSRLRESHPDITVTSDLVPRLAALIGLVQPDLPPSPGPVEAAVPGASQPGDIDALDSLLRLASQDGPVVVVLDDAQWMTEGLVNVSWQLSQRVAGPVGFVISARPDLPDYLAGALDRVGALRGGEGPLEIDLMPLNDATISQLMVQVLGGPVEESTESLIRERAAGNPFFLGEILTFLHEQGVLREDESGWTVHGSSQSLVPSGVRAVLAARADELSAVARDVLRNASVIGSPLTTQALGALSSGSSADVHQGLQELLDRGMLRPAEGDAFAFTSALFQEVVYAGVPKADRAHRHVRMARWTARAGDGGDWARPWDDKPWEDEDQQAHHVTDQTVATHADRALDLAQDMGLPESEVLEPLRSVAAPAFARLGNRALARLEAAEALRHFERVVLLTGDQLPPVIRLNRAWALVGAQRLDAAKVEATALAQEDDPAVRSGAHLVLETIARAHGDRWVAMAHVNQALAIASNASLPVEAGRSLRRLGLLHFFSGHLAESETAFAEALALAEDSGDTQSLGWTLQHMAWTKAMRGEYEEALDVLSWAESTFKQAGFRGGLAWVEGTRAMTWLLQGRYMDAWRQTSRLIGVEEAGAAGGATGSPEGSQAPGPPAGMRGSQGPRNRWSQPVAPAQAATDLWGVAVLLSMRSLAGSALGRYEEAGENAQRSLETMQLVHDSWGESLALVALGQNQFVRGDLSGGAETLELALRRSIEGRAPFTGVLALGFLGYLNLTEGRPELAEARARRGLDILRRTDVDRRALLPFEALVAIAIGRLSRTDEALAMLEPLVAESLQGVEGVLFARARLLAHFAETLAAAGRVDEAVEWADRASRTPGADALTLLLAEGVRESAARTRRIPTAEAS